MLVRLCVCVSQLINRMTCSPSALFMYIFTPCGGVAVHFVCVFYLATGSDSRVVLWVCSFSRFFLLNNCI